MVELTKNIIATLPKYVRLGEDTHTILRLRNPEYNQFPGWRNNVVEYYRDAGWWAVDFEFKEGKLLSVSSDKNLNGKVLKEVSYQEWKKSNEGHISRSTKAYTWK